MKNLLRAEFLKTRRRYLFLTALLIIGAQLVFAFYNSNYSAEDLQNGWLIFLYQFPLLNTIFLPLLTTFVASRLADLEHKQQMLRHLLTLTSRNRLYNSKLLYGFGIVFFCLLLQLAAIYTAGTLLGFTSPFPWRLFAVYGLFTAVATAVLYLLQNGLSLLFKNQVIPFVVGVWGEFLGIFAMFLPFWVAKCIPWGYYGALQMVLMDWDRATRISTYYLQNPDWLFFGVEALVAISFYFLFKKCFLIKEV